MADDLTLKIEKRFPSGATVEAELELPQSPPSVTVLFGPSGSGKTTILRCLAGLERPDRGIICHDKEVWYDGGRGISLSPQRRRIGYLFQEYALFPHLTVKRNLEYGLSQRSKEQRAQHVGHLIGLFQLSGLESRYPRQLSGGQIQRVALARTLAPEPQLLLLDEPLSALDDATRSRLRSELRRQLTEVRVPTIVVTHDRVEAIALGDRMAVLVAGRIQQTGPIQEVFSYPANEVVARSVGVETVLPGRIVAASNALVTVEVGPVRLTAVDPGDLPSPEVHVCIRAEDVILETRAGGQDSARNHLSGRITSVLPEGVLTRVAMDCGVPIMALVTRQSGEDLHLRQGDRVAAVIKATSIHLVSRLAG
ncbi:MAG TPA: ABC transporter ATP-binding protein [Terriglobia bacterium]|nr:ABC transporter ATP-binding protein [Terriglobia bacterium]